MAFDVSAGSHKDKKRTAEKRSSFSIPPETQIKLQEIKELSGAASYIDVIRNALTLYEDYVKSPAEGFIYVRKKVEEDSMPVILNVAALSK